MIIGIDRSFRAIIQLGPVLNCNDHARRYLVVLSRSVIVSDGVVRRAINRNAFSENKLAKAARVDSTRVSHDTKTCGVALKINLSVH